MPKEQEREQGKKKTREEICNKCNKLCIKMVSSDLYCSILGKEGFDKREY